MKNTCFFFAEWGVPRPQLREKNCPNFLAELGGTYLVHRQTRLVESADELFYIRISI